MCRSLRRQAVLCSVPRKGAALRPGASTAYATIIYTSSWGLTEMQYLGFVWQLP